MGLGRKDRTLHLQIICYSQLRSYQLGFVLVQNMYVHIFHQILQYVHVMLEQLWLGGTPFHLSFLFPPPSLFSTPSYLPHYPNPSAASSPLLLRQLVRLERKGRGARPRLFPCISTLFSVLHGFVVGAIHQFGGSDKRCSWSFFSRLQLRHRSVRYHPPQ